MQKKESVKSHIAAVHHIGMVVSDIKTKVAFYSGSLGYKVESGIIHEPSQKVYVQFLALGNYRLELIQPEGEDSPVYRFLQNKGVINHLCYQTDDIEASISFFRKEYKAILTSGPEESESMDGCKIAFLARPDGEIIELVELTDGEYS